jgi:HAD superfamily hydrolase (TIGR01549 family)
MNNHQVSAVNYQLVIFDLDGTLYNKHGLSLRMVCHAPFNIRKMQAERHVRSTMKGIWLGDEYSFYNKYFQHLANTLQISQQDAQQWYNQRYMPLMVRLIGKYHPIGKWVLPFIEECKAKGIKMVVLSDYGHAHEKLQALGISPTLFDWVIAAPELGGLKPAPELLHKVAEKMGIPPEQCLVIGDRDDTDGAMAYATGAQFHKVSY